MNKDNRTFNANNMSYCSLKGSLPQATLGVGGG